MSEAERIYTKKMKMCSDEAEEKVHSLSTAGDWWASVNVTTSVVFQMTCHNDHPISPLQLNRLGL